MTSSVGSPRALCLIAGTGSIAWWEPDAGFNTSPTVIRAGGYGAGISDEGSGFWIA